MPLAIHAAEANASDHTQIIPVVMDFPRVGGKPGRPKELPDEVYADRRYDSEGTRGLLRWLGIEPRIATRGEAHVSGFGKVRWGVERTISWIKGRRRMRVRYDRRGGVPNAFTTIAACVVCLRILDDGVLEKHRFCQSLQYGFQQTSSTRRAGSVSDRSPGAASRVGLRSLTLPARRVEGDSRKAYKSTA